MQTEILRFLLLARAHLRDWSHAGRSANDDLQAVDRMLPDADWFERAEIEPALPRAVDLWPRERLTF